MTKLFGVPVLALCLLACQQVAGTTISDLTCNLGCGTTTITEATHCTKSNGATVTVGAWLNEFANLGAQICPIGTSGGTQHKGTISPARPYHKSDISLTIGKAPVLITTFHKVVSDKCGSKTVTAKLLVKRCCTQCSSLKMHPQSFWNQHVCSASTNSQASLLRTCATKRIASVDVNHSLEAVWDLFCKQSTYRLSGSSLLNLKLFSFINLRVGGLSFPGKSVCGLVTSTSQTNNPYALMASHWGNMYCGGANPHLSLSVPYLISKVPECQAVLGVNTGSITLLQLHHLAIAKLYSLKRNVLHCLGGLLGGVSGNTWDCTALTNTGTC